MELLDRIAEEEEEFPRLLANYQEWGCGTLLYSEKIKGHRGGDHAVLYPKNIENSGVALDKIRMFCQGKKSRQFFILDSVQISSQADNKKALKPFGCELVAALASL